MAEAGKRKKDRWGLFLLIWALVLLLLGVGCCCFLYRYLDVYEKTRPEPVVDAYLAQNGAEQLMKAAQSNVQLDVTEFEDPSDLYAAYLSTVDTDRPLTYRPRTKDRSEQQLVYTVYCGNKEICTLVLSPEGTSPGFGRHRWTVSEVRSAPITDTLPSLQVAVDALAARATSHLGATVQLSDTGIQPGAGIGGARPALTEKTVGAPVLALGVPTVVESETLVKDALSRFGIEEDMPEFSDLLHGVKSFFVTPKEIDLLVPSLAALLADSIEKAFSV